MIANNIKKQDQPTEELLLQLRARVFKIISIVVTAISLPFYTMGAILAGAAAERSSALGAMVVIILLAMIAAIVSVAMALTLYSAGKYEKSIKASIICLISVAMPIIITILLAPLGL